MGLTKEQILELLKPKSANQQIRVAGSDIFYVHGFDKSALFLLELGFINLFEPWYVNEPDGNWWRCKGCGRMVKRLGRESHHSWHKRELLTLT